MEKIRLQMGLLCNIEKQIQSISGTLTSFQETVKNLDINLSNQEKPLEVALKQLSKSKLKIEQEIIESIEANHNQEQINNLCTIPGVSKFVACLITHYFDPNLTIKAWIAFIGLDISVAQSGKWKSQGKISKRGKPYFRKRLYGCAWGAIMHDSKLKDYYYSLKKKGRKHTESLVIIARKILGVAHSVVNNNTIYIDSYLTNSSFN
jgi:transposase